MAKNSTTIYLGKTAEKSHVYADISVEDSDGRTMTFTDHTTGPAPERVSLSFVTSRSYRDDPRDINDRYVESWGQVSAEDRVIADPATEHVALIERAWETQHLNDMNAACEHMTEEILTPSEEQLEAYAAGNPREARYGRQSLLQGWRLKNAVCPETGYKWGQSWLARKPDPEIVAELRKIIADNEK